MIRSKTAALARATLASGAAAAASFPASSARADIPAYAGFQLQASDRSGALLNVPSGQSASISGNVVPLGNNRQVAFRYSTSVGSGYYPTQTDFIWYGQSATGSPVASTTSFLGLGTNAIANDGRLAFSANNGFTVPPGTTTRGKGLYTYAPATGHTAVSTAEVSWNAPAITADGLTVGSLVTTAAGAGREALRRYTLAGGSTDYAVESGVDATSPYTNLATGTYGTAGHFVTQVTSTDPAQNGRIVRFNPPGSPTATTVISRPADVIGNSNYAVGGNGAVAYASNPADSGTGSTLNRNEQIVYTADGVTYTTIASTVAAGGTGLRVIETNFAPAVNAGGLVAFTATPVGGTEGLYLGDGVGLRRLVGVGDSVPLATGGSATISDVLSFLDVNDAGDVSFIAAYTGGGKGVYVATVPEPASTAAAGVAAAGMLMARRRRRPSVD